MFVEGKPWIVFFLQTLYFMPFIETVEKIITYALGEHDPGSAQDWRKSSDFWGLVIHDFFKHISAGQTHRALALTIDFEALTKMIGRKF